MKTKRILSILLVMLTFMVQTTTADETFSKEVVALRNHYLGYNCEIQHGSVVYAWYYSKTISEYRRLAIYLPPSYFTQKNNYYPVLYLLHGTYGDEDNWIRRGAANIIDNLIVEGKAEEMIVVMPNTNMWQQACPTITGIPDPYTDIVEASLHLMDGRFEESFTEIISFTEQNFRTRAKKNSRAIAGLSRGGFFAMHLSHYLNNVFDYVGMFSPTFNTRMTREPMKATDAFFPVTKQTPKVYRNVEKDMKRQFQQAPALYWIAIGKDDFLYQENVYFRNWLDKNGYKYLYHESAGAHQWENWQDYLILFAPKLFK